jgi:hypothetical protein
MGVAAVEGRGVRVCSWPRQSKRLSIATASRAFLASVSLASAPHSRSQFVDASGIQPAASASATIQTNEIKKKKLYHPRLLREHTPLNLLFGKNSLLLLLPNCTKCSLAPHKFRLPSVELFSFNLFCPKFQRILPKQLFYMAQKVEMQGKGQIQVLFLNTILS